MMYKILIFLIVLTKVLFSIENSNCFCISVLIPLSVGNQAPSFEMKRVLTVVPKKGWKIDVKNLSPIAKVPQWIKQEKVVESYYIIRSNILLDAHRYGVFLNKKSGEIIIVKVDGLDGTYSYFSFDSNKGS